MQAPATRDADVEFDHDHATTMTTIDRFLSVNCCPGRAPVRCLTVAGAGEYLPGDSHHTPSGGIPWPM